MVDPCVEEILKETVRLHHKNEPAQKAFHEKMRRDRREKTKKWSDLQRAGSAENSGAHLTIVSFAEAADYSK